MSQICLNINSKYPQSFTGKERDSETGFSYFGARYYDSDILTGWLSVDPMADKYPNISPYAYCGWNPVRLVDPNGREIILSESAKKIHDKFNALCVEMEGASIAQVCYLCNIPFLIIRSISDTPNNNNAITFDEFLITSSNKVANLMIKLIKKLNEEIKGK